jgi:hypothetical protein
VRAQRSGPPVGPRRPGAEGDDVERFGGQLAQPRARRRRQPRVQRRHPAEPVPQRRRPAGGRPGGVAGVGPGGQPAGDEGVDQVRRVRRAWSRSGPRQRLPAALAGDGGRGLEERPVHQPEQRVRRDEGLPAPGRRHGRGGALDVGPQAGPLARQQGCDTGQVAAAGPPRGHQRHDGVGQPVQHGPGALGPAGAQGRGDRAEGQDRRRRSPGQRPVGVVGQAEPLRGGPDEHEDGGQGGDGDDSRGGPHPQGRRQRRQPPAAGRPRRPARQRR